MVPQPSTIAQLSVQLRGAAQLRGYLALRDLAGADGVAVLRGGVRGWAEAMGCSAAYPKRIFAELEAAGLIAGLEFYPARGGQVVEVHLTSTRSMIESVDTSPPADDLPPHQDAATRSMIESPPHPPMRNHESMQQQQHGDAVACSTEPEGGAGDGLMTRLLLDEFPGADLALLAAWEADPFVNDCKAARDALAGFPAARLTDWRTDLRAAEDRPTSRWPPGLVLAAWARGERITPARAAGPPASPAPRQRGRAVPPPPAAPEPPPPDDAAGDNDSPIAVARRLLPDAHPLDLAPLAELLDSGLDETAALAAYHERRQAAEATERRRRAAYQERFIGHVAAD